MIVRCNNCVSAFAVDDEKVADKKFAFTCPKCHSENIIDNRLISSSRDEIKSQPEESFFNDDFSIDTDLPAKEREESSAPDSFEDDLFLDEKPSGKEKGKEKEEDSFDSFEDDLATEFPADDLLTEPVKSERKINLEIEESADFPEIDDDIFAEKAPASKKEISKDIPSDETASFETEDEFISFDEKEELVIEEQESAKSPSDEFDIELKDESVKPEEEDIFFDDFDEAPVEGTGKEDSLKDDSIKEETEFDFEDIETESISEESKSDRETKLKSQDDIDALFAEEGIVFDEKPISKQGELDFEDEITVDLDLLDIELEDGTGEKPEPAELSDLETPLPAEENITLDIDNLDIDLEETSAEDDIFAEPAARPKAKAAPAEEDITLDIDNLDIDLEETSTEDDIFAEPAARPKAKAAPAEEDITLDIDNLNIDLEETSIDSDIFAEPAPARTKAKAAPAEEDITLDIDNLDIDLEEASIDADIFAEPAARPKAKAAQAEDDITLDIDNLDIDLEETSIDSDIFAEPAPARTKAKAAPAEDDITLDIDNLDIDLDETSFEPVTVKSSKPAGKKEIPFEDDLEFNEEDIKLNLDDLDIDLEEIEHRELIFEDDIVEKPVIPLKQKVKKPLIEEVEEDESITIDLDTLEIEIAEENRAIEDTLAEEDEKLTLDDAGLTFDELTSDVKKSAFEEHADEDLKLTLDDIDPDLTLDKIARSAPEESVFVSDSLDELPEIDLDEYDAIVRQEESRASKKSHEEPMDDFEDEFISFPDTDEKTEKTETPRRDYDIFEYDESEHEKSMPETGGTFFSIDFSLKYSRIGALLRLLFLYNLSMIPHLIVMLIYTILSSIVGFINQIVILSTGRCVEDFALVIENTMRYFFYIKSNILGIVEDRPVYAGRESIDHPLQMNITYPLKYSKNFAILRLSIIGIILVTLPHLIIMSLVTLTIPIVYLTGIISVIITRRWPNVLFTYLTNYFRYLARISSFMTGLTDEYPPFKFD